MDYQGWKASVLGKVLGDGQCAAVVVNNDQSYTAALFPGVNWESVFAPVESAKQLLTDNNTHYLVAIENDHNDPNQLPQQGDIMVFDSTPSAGYSDAYDNPYGHTGVCDGASSAGYTLVQQNAPYFGSPVNVTTYPWHFRPCLGWLRPVSVSVPEYYTVQPGDTVYGICEQNGISIDNGYQAFRDLNPQISDINLIYPGEHVRVK